jgi:hypothetical protein
VRERLRGARISIPKKSETIRLPTLVA